MKQVLYMLPHHQHIKLFDCTQFVFHDKFQSLFHITDGIKDCLSTDGMSPFTAINDMRPFPLQPSQEKSNRGKNMDLRKLFTITFQLRTGLGDLDDCTVVEKGPQPFVLNVLKLDCSEGSINGWHMLSIS